MEWDELATMASVWVAIGCGGAAAVVAGQLDAAFRATARRTALCGALLALLSFGANAAIEHGTGLPRAFYHDEFAYLLQADTFAHGRVTNPTPPLWQHFEVPHVLLRPSYMSKYPPGQGLAMALGQVVTGQPIVGVWLSTAAAVVAVYWMLLAFASRPWALAGGLLAAVNPTLLQWSQTYWGGSVAVAGAAAALGGWGRLMRGKPLVGATVGLGIGLTVLANSRPFEGFVFAVPLMVSLALRARSATRAGGDLRHRWEWGRRVTLPLVAIAAVAGAAMLYYDARVTGHPFRLPFMEYARQYDVYSKFWMFPPRADVPVYHNASQAFVHTVFERGNYDQMRSVTGLGRVALARLGLLAQTQLAPLILALPLLAGLCLTAADVRVRWLWAVVGLSLLGGLAETIVLAHYTAPLLPVTVLLVTMGLRWTWGQRWRARPAGAALARCLVLGALAGSVVQATELARADYGLFGREFLTSYQQGGLRAGRHLVFVRVLPGYTGGLDWAYNGADPAAQRILWARDLGPDSDAAFIRQFPGRQTWLLVVGEHGNQWGPYPPRP